VEHFISSFGNDKKHTNQTTSQIETTNLVYHGGWSNIS